MNDQCATDLARPSPRHWWETAPLAARLRQVRAASSMGLSRRDTATLLGTNREVINVFALRHDIPFMDEKRIRLAGKASDHDAGGTLPLDVELARMGAW